VRTLKVKCPTWQHVETFYSRKLRKDKTLTLRVPFQPEEGTQLTIGLELPDGEVINVPGTVIGVEAGEDGERNAMRLFLHGLDATLLERLKVMVASARSTTSLDPVPPRHAAKAGARASTAPAAPPSATLGPSRSGPTFMPAATTLPASKPEDAPVDELVEPPVEPTADDVSEYERDVFLYLEGELRRLRQSAAYEVLGVDEHADVTALRAAYFELTKQFHPDLFARYRSHAILHMAQELFIHINKAYDRMRNALVAAGHAIVAGPALIPHEGWLAGMDDIHGPGDERSFDSARMAAPQRGGRSVPEHIEDQPSGRQGISDLLALVRTGKFEEARERVAAALHFDPRDRRMRALYHVISGRELMAAGEETAAATQFEAALAHDRNCREAREAIEELRATGLHSGLYPRTLR
jgi:curved DNA-binding protein CbpA